MEAESSNVIIIEKLSPPVTERNLPSQKPQDFVPSKRKERFRNKNTPVHFVVRENFNNLNILLYIVYNFLTILGFYL